MTSFGAAVVADARKYLGIPYVWGGTDPKRGLDCSGLTQLVMHDLGVNIPRVTGAQQTAGQRVASVKDAQPGDLMFHGAPVSGHVVIYAGGNRIIHAPKTGDVVKEANLYFTPTYIRRFSPGPTTGDRIKSAGLGALFGVPGAVIGGVTGKNPVTVVGGAAADAAGGVLSGLDAVGGFFNHLGERGTWVRVLQVVGGAGLIVGGLVIVGKGVIADVAVSAIPGGAVLQAAAGK